MTLWNPVYRVKVNGTTATSATLAGLTVTSGRTDIYSQPIAGYCNLNLIETNQTEITYEINDSVTVEVQDSTGTYVTLFGGFITDIQIQVQTSGSTALSQQINIIAVGALARLARAVYTGNLASDYEGDQIYEILQTLLLNEWNEVPASLTWANYNPLTTWANAENTGLGEIDRPGNYDLDSQNNLNDTIYNIVSKLATSGLGYLYEDNQGRIGYADSTHRSDYWANNGFIELDANHAIGPGLRIVKRAGDVRNNVTISYTSSGNSTHNESDADSILLYGQLATTIATTLKNQSDAEDQALFYLALRKDPAYAMNSISFPIASTEIDDSDRDNLLEVFMGMPVRFENLPTNMVNGQFEGFVEGWTWTAGYNSLRLDLTVSPFAFSIQTYQWQDVDAAETWNTLSATLTWEDATIVA
jgi:hypothetical protein